jgi:hypothetical protein
LKDVFVRVVPFRDTTGVFQKIERLAKDRLDESLDGLPLLGINVLQQLRIDCADDYVKESAHSRVTIEPL